MLPTADILRSLSWSDLARVVELHLNPLSTLVIARCLELRLFERLANGPVPRNAIDLGIAFGHEPGAHDLVIESALAFGLIEETSEGLRNSAMTGRHLLVDGQVPLLGLTERFGMYAACAGELASTLRFMRFADRTLWSDRASVAQQNAIFARRRATAVQADPRRRYFWDTAALMVLPHLDRVLRPDATIVDVGCALGSLPALLHRLYPSARVHGVDIDFRDADYLAVTRELLAEAGARVQLIAANVLESVAEVPRADLLTANRILSGTHPGHGDGWIRRFFEMLAPGGTFVGVDFLPVGVPAHDAAYMQHFLLLMAWNYRELTDRPVLHDLDERVTWGWTSPWKPATLEAAFTRAGFVEFSIRSLLPPFAVIEARRPA